MEIINFDTVHKNEKHIHHELLPNSIRCVICGPSNCGKTNLLVNLLLLYLNYDKLHIYSKSLQQPKYKMLQEWAAQLNKLARSTVVSFHSDDVLPVEQLNPKERTVMVFDDVMLEKQTPIEKYFSQGRHGGADCLYLCQSYFRIPKQAIRDNINLLVLFNQDVKNLRAIHDTFIGGDMDFDEFRRFFAKCTAEKFGFAVIDLTSEPTDGKYRSRFDNAYIPKQYTSELVCDSVR